MSVFKSKTFSLDEKAAKSVDFIRYKLRLGKRSAVIRRAITLLRLAVEASEDGKQLCLKNGDKFEVIHLD